MKEMMRVAVMNGRQDVSIEQRPIPTPGPGEVLIRIRIAGVCGSDLHYYAEGKIGDIPVQTPFVLGHEIAGTVVALGADVQGLREGQLVAVEPGFPAASVRCADRATTTSARRCAFWPRRPTTAPSPNTWPIPRSGYSPFRRA